MAAVTNLTVDDLIARGLRKAGESDDATRFSESVRLDMASEAQIAAVRGVIPIGRVNGGRFIPGLRMEAQDTLITLEEGEDDYALASDVKSVVSVEYKQSTNQWVRLEPEHPKEQDLDNLYRSGWPQWYSLRENLIRIRPVPSGDETSVIRIRHIDWEARVTATTDAVFGGRAVHRPHQHILAIHVKSQILADDQKVDLANAAMEEFERGLLAANYSQNSRNRDSKANIQPRPFRGGRRGNSRNQPWPWDNPWGKYS